jgi:small nuclear ribonucleoprotein (snRNP)-like protein
MDPKNAPASNEAAQKYLTSLLNKQLLIHITDGRIFSGDFKCTDNVQDWALLLCFT